MRDIGVTGVQTCSLPIFPVLAREGPLGTLHPGYAVLLGGEPVLPLLFGSLYLSRRICHTPILARVRSARCYIAGPWGSRAAARSAGEGVVWRRGTAGRGA